MVYIAFKVLLSAGIIVLVSELSKKSPFLGGLLASLPLISLLGLIWLYIDTRDPGQVSRLSGSIFWLVLPSLSLFLLLPLLLKKGWSFQAALPVGLAVMIGLYYLMVLGLRRLGVVL